MAFHIFPPTRDLWPFMLFKEMAALGHLQVYSPRNVTCSGLSAQSWRTNLGGTVRNAHACSWQGVWVQGNPYHKWQGYGFLRCLPRGCLGSPISSGVTGGGVWQSRGIFKEEKRKRHLVLFQWKRRLRRKWQVQRERERIRSGISWKLWFVWGQWGRA